ncbi:hypothetical protein ACJ41O_012845 [Fusarium nematophilum]
MIYRNEEKLEYPRDITLSELLLNYNLNNTPAHKPAIIDGISGETAFTYSTFRSSVRKLARHFRHEVGIGPGAVEIRHALKLSQPSHIFVEKAMLPRLIAAIAKGTLPKIPALYIWDSSQPEVGVAQALDIEDIIRHGSDDFEPTRLSPGAAAKQLAFICFSSGTSGLVKGVRLSHGNVVANIFQQSQTLRGMFNPSTVVALVVPFFHILGLAGFSCQYVCQGAPIVAFRRFELRPLLDAVKRHRITHINVVPPIALEFLKNPIADTGDYSSVQCLVNAAAPLSQQQANALEKRLGCVVTQWYGMTEASPSIASQREDETNVPGTIGRLLPGIEMRVLDEEDKDTRVGQFAIRGPNIMQGYVHGEEQVDSPMTSDGFMKTGDIGFVNDKGYLFIVDRAKEMIKVKGHQVAPAEIEAILITHPLVNDAAVCGMYNDHGTSEIPVAYITTNVQDLQEQEILKAEVLSYVHGKVARYKQITGGIHVLPEIPRKYAPHRHLWLLNDANHLSPAGKILRRLLPAKLGPKGRHASAEAHAQTLTAKL